MFNYYGVMFFPQYLNVCAENKGGDEFDPFKNRKSGADWMCKEKRGKFTDTVSGENYSV